MVEQFVRPLVQVQPFRFSFIRELYRGRKWRVPTKFAVALFLGLTTAYCIRKMLLLPILPLTTPDSEGYLSFADFRPPGYPIFLWIHCAIFGGLAYLPQIQCGLFFASIVLLALSIARLTRNILSAFLIAGFGAYFAPAFDPGSVMSDCMYASVIATATATFVLAVSSERLGLIALAALLFALAAVTRTIGYSAILVLVLSLIVLIFTKKIHAGAAVALAGGPIALVFISACAITYMQTSHFRISSYGGMSLLGKGLMVAVPLPVSNSFSSLNWVPDETKPARLELDRAPSLHIEMLLLVQYYDYLRYDKMAEEFDRRWPEWSNTHEGYDRAKLALELSKEYITANPLAYTKLALLDYLGLWSMPRSLTAREHGSLRRIWEEMDVAYLTSFAKTDRGQSNYRAVIPAPEISALQVWVRRAVSGSFALASVLAPIILLMRRSRVTPSIVASLVLLGLNVHFAYVVTAMVEAGSDRYIFPTWPLMVAALTLLPNLIFSASDEVSSRA
jgi:hypothetical protein